MSDVNPAAMPVGVTPYITPKDARAAVELYKAAFGAEVVDMRPTPDGRLMHCGLRINGGLLMMSDAFPDHGYPYEAPQGFALHLQVDDARAWAERAVAAGFVITMPIEKQFWGDIYGQLRDPQGILWSLGSNQ